ncbi:DUF4436 family protein [Amycolatopsis sp. GM8]|uniref:DUF4436 family protein n=1 Tax=Amycolatopsis sp. GM8 TaxID=2896530 RepID=UPI0035AC0DE6
MAPGGDSGLDLHLTRSTAVLVFALFMMMTLRALAIAVATSVSNTGTGSPLYSAANSTWVRYPSKG